jgi:putative flippase GtrA
MDEPRRFDAARLWQQYGARLLRYGGVTIVSTVIGLTVLAFGIFVLDWPALTANVLSVLVSTPPSYLLNRRWVWEKNGSHSVGAEVRPFWIMALLGLVVSTVIVSTVDRYTDTRIIILFAQMASFGLLWLLKFAFLEKVLWKAEEPTPDTQPV